MGWRDDLFTITQTEVEMTLKVAKAPAYDEINDIPEVREEEVPHLRDLFEKTMLRETYLSNDDIVNVIAYSSDDREDEDWVRQMVRMEDGQLPEPCPEFGDVAVDE